MFRIKTDVRQYKCESHDKVVRLIRNWVIRPTDQIYDEETDTWEPIGEHDAFVSTFREMEKAEEGVAETVVSPELDDEQAPDGEPAEPANDADEHSDTDEQPEEGESAVEDESSDEGSDDAVVVGQQGDPEEVTAVTAAADSQDNGSPEPPTAPEGVTTGRDYADSDEITVMTEETLDAVLEDGDENDGDIEAANAQERPPRDDLNDDLDDGEEAEAKEPPTIPPDEETEPGGDAPDEIDEPDADEKPSESSETASDGADDSESVTTREDLPEEVFATDRIERDKVDTESREDGSEDASESGTSETDEATGTTDQQTDESDADEWDEILQRLRDTDELDGEEIDRIQETREELAIGRDEPVDDEPTDQTAEYYGASGGYEWDLPDYVAPTPADRSHGLTAESVTKDEKDAVFPYPGPKQQDNVYTREFDLGSGKSNRFNRTMLIRIGVAAAVVVVVILLFAM